MIEARQIAFGYKRKPYDAEIEYLESTGTQYIDLPFGFYKTDEVHASFSVKVTTNLADKYIVAPIAWNDSNNRFGLGVHTQWVDLQKDYVFAYGNLNTGESGLTPLTKNDGLIHHWSYRNQIATITDLGLRRDVSTIVFGNETRNLRLFYGYNAPTEGKVVSYRHIKDSEIVIDLIPVRKGNIGYMYDRVSGQLFGNQGTGEFVLGPDIIGYTAKDYVQDGLVAMWDGIENAGWGVHDPSAKAWVDLISGSSAYADATMTFGDDYMLLGASIYGINISPELTSAISANHDFTVELLSETGDTTYNSHIMLYSGKGSANFMPVPRRILYAGAVVYSLSVAEVGTNSSLVLVRSGTDVFAAHDGVIVASKSGIDADIGLAFYAYATKHKQKNIRIYNRALTADEIAHNYEIDKARFGI